MRLNLSALSDPSYRVPNLTGFKIHCVSSPPLGTPISKFLLPMRCSISKLFVLIILPPGMPSCIILRWSFFYYILTILSLTFTPISQLFCGSFFGACKENSLSSKWFSLPHPDHHFKVLDRRCISVSSRHLLPLLPLAPYFYLWFVSSIPDPMLSQFKWTFFTKIW